jgi:acetyl-CoA carboxylase alpha subunit
MSDAIEQELVALDDFSPDELRANRRDKYVAMGKKSLA